GLRQVPDGERVVVAAPFAFFEDGGGDLDQGQVVEGVGVGAVGLAADEQRAVRADIVGELLAGGVSELLGSDVDEVGLSGLAVLPVFLGVLARRVGVAHVLAQSLGQHLGIVVLGDDP